MNKALIGFFVVVLLLIGGFYTLNRSRSASQNMNVAPTQNPNVSPSPNDLGLGGSSYMDPDGVFVVLYPNDYTMDAQNEGAQVRFIKFGETQTGQTEIYDGVLVVIEKFMLNGETLSDWVDARIDQATTDESFEVTQEKRPTTINDQPAFTYTIRGLGENQTYVVQKDENSENIVVITTLVADPENVGYQAEVDAMLATLQVQQ